MAEVQNVHSLAKLQLKEQFFFTLYTTCSLLLQRLFLAQKIQLSHISNHMEILIWKCTNMNFKHNFNSKFNAKSKRNKKKDTQTFISFRFKSSPSDRE